MRPFLVLLTLAAPAFAQTYTTAAEVRPLLDLTKQQWISVREWDGQDLLYFTHLESWRCGLESVTFGLNGEEPTQPYDLAPCDETSANPNALDVENHLPFISLPLKSVGTVSIRITYDDGSTDEADYERNTILIP